MIQGIDEDSLDFISRMNKSMIYSRNPSKEAEFPSPDEAMLREEILAKYVLISAVSYFESSIKEDIRFYFSGSFNEEEKFLMNFINESILDRGFYSLFDWDENNKGNINTFLRKFFGKGSRYEDIKEKIGERKDLKHSILAFYAMFAMRNEIIHENAHNSSIGHTLEKIIGYYEDAKFFIENFKIILNGDVDGIPENTRSKNIDSIDLRLLKKQDLLNK
ncbi:Uncharacterised protein [Mycobacterium tuberculosis]|nr:Uncharacterised protein [Mycobacterium tuberculosis]